METPRTPIVLGLALAQARPSCAFKERMQWLKVYILHPILHFILRFTIICIVPRIYGVPNFVVR